jgi:two-component system response regulator HydG
MEDHLLAAKILIVDNEANARRVLQAIVEAAGHQTVLADDYESAVSLMQNEEVGVVVTDVKLPDKSGLDLFEFVKQHHPDIPVIFLTAFGSVESAVEAMTCGAFYYFIKPPDYAIFKGILSRALEQRRLKKELEMLRFRLEDSQAVPSLIGKNPAVRKLHHLIDVVKDSDSSVLLTGETGTGKDVVARRIHFLGARRNRNFVPLNCAAIPDNLLESELFGSEKGAFSGAVGRRIGKIEDADGGTLFLDEIGEMDQALCAKLLRALQEKEIERLGSNRRIKVDFRLISSTNRDLFAEVRAGLFREDLYYRINVVEINMPPLRERCDDIPLLAVAFLRESCAKENKLLEFAPEAMRALCAFSWPGNIRQLRNVVERTVVLCGGPKIRVSDLPGEVFSQTGGSSSLPIAGQTLKELEASAVRSALERSSGNKSRAAALLGISRKALYKKIQDYGILLLITVTFRNIF